MAGGVGASLGRDQKHLARLDFTLRNLQPGPGRGEDLNGSSQEGGIESAGVWGLQEGFRQQQISELGHLIFQSQPSSGEEGTWQVGEASPGS